MQKILTIDGALRGKVQTEIFGTMTLPEYDEPLRGYAAELGLDVEIFFDAALFNPAAFSTGYPALVAAISQVRFPTVEVHISNPVRRGPVSETTRVSQGMVTGFGLPGYYLALLGVRDMLAATT
jgi:3-dehydroquinate dehydratase II